VKHNGNDKLGYGIWLYFSIEYMIATVVALETPLCKDNVGGSLTRDDLKVEEGSRVIVPPLLPCRTAGPICDAVFVRGSWWGGEYISPFLKLSISALNVS